MAVETKVILSSIYMKILESDDLEDIRLFVKELMEEDKAASIELTCAENKKRKSLK